MAYELRFYGEDPALTLSEIRSLLNLGAANVQSVVRPAGNPLVETTAPAKPTSTRARRTVETKATPDSRQVDLEEAIAEKAKSDELNDDISDVGGERDEPEQEDAAGVHKAEPVSKDALRTKLIELMNAKGEEAPAKLLKDEFGVAKIGELKESDYAAAWAKADEAIKKGEEK